MAAQPAVTAEDLDNWLTPLQAVELLKSAYRSEHLAIQTLLERLRGGMVQAVSRETKLEGRKDSATLAPIPIAHWDFVRGASSFWTTGDLVYNFRPQGEYESLTLRHFDVRFEPKSVRAIIGNEADRAPVSGESPGEPTDKGLPVSEAHLQAWYEVYKQAYRGAADTEDTALKSARGMFPGKSVSREKIRELRGPQKRGRKSGEIAK
jgi:hypothetical protein